MYIVNELISTCPFTCMASLINQFPARSRNIRYPVGFVAQGANGDCGGWVKQLLEAIPVVLLVAVDSHWIVRGTRGSWRTKQAARSQIRLGETGFFQRYPQVALPNS